MAVARTDSVIVYRLGSGNPLATLPATGQQIWSLAFSPDGTRIATATEDGVTRLWEPSTGKMTAECRGHTSKVLGVAFRPDGKRLVTSSLDGTVRQWDPDNRPGGRVAVLSTYGGSQHGGIQSRRTPSRLGRHRPDRPPLGCEEPARPGRAPWPYRGDLRPGVHPRR